MERRDPARRHGGAPPLCRDQGGHPRRERHDALPAPALAAGRGRARAPRARQLPGPRRVPPDREGRRAGTGRGCAEDLGARLDPRRGHRTMPRLQIVIASTRPGRVGQPVAEWFTARAEAHGAFELEVVALAELALPLLDEPHHPRLRRYVNPHTKAWSERVDTAD